MCVSVAHEVRQQLGERRYDISDLTQQQLNHHMACFDSRCQV